MRFEVNRKKIQLVGLNIVELWTETRKNSNWANWMHLSLVSWGDITSTILETKQKVRKKMKAYKSAI